MILVMTHPMIQASTSNGKETQETNRKRKAHHRSKEMTMFKKTEKVKAGSRQLSSLKKQSSKLGSTLTSLVRIQIEEVQRKVRSLSPAALQFIGPGDYAANPIQEGGIPVLFIRKAQAPWSAAYGLELSN